MAVIGKDFAYLALPRTASRAIERWLEAIGGERKRLTDGQEGVLSQHARLSIAELNGKYLFTCVRHPFQRLVSAWRHCQGDRQPFAEWLEYMVTIQRNGYAYGDQFCWRSQAEYLDLHPGIHTIRFEDLPGSLTTLPFVRGHWEENGIPPFPEGYKGENHKYTDNWRRHYGRRELELALQHSGDDFERLGYPIL